MAKATSLTWTTIATTTLTLWANYVQGVAWSLEQSGLRLAGMDAVLGGNVSVWQRIAAGAAVEVGAAQRSFPWRRRANWGGGPEIARARPAR